MQKVKMPHLKKKRLLLIPVLIVLVGCATISPFNEKAYEQATSLKVESLKLMDKASESYSSHETEVDALKLNLEKAYEYAKGRPQNEDSEKQWAIIIDPDRNSLGGFLKRWKDEKTLDKKFIKNAKDLVSDGFDAVIGLESGKRKSQQ